MSGIFKRIGGWLAAVFTTVILGIGFQTQNVLARLEGIGADVALADRLSMTFYDIQYLGSLYAICLLYTSPSPRDLSTSRMPSSA